MTASICIGREVIIPFGLASMLLQAAIYAWTYPKLFSTRRDEWLASATRFAGIFATLAWSFTTLPVAAKYQMTSVTEFMKLESAFTILQFAIVSPLIALAYRGAPAYPSAERSSEEGSRAA